MDKNKQITKETLKLLNIGDKEAIEEISKHIERVAKLLRVKPSNLSLKFERLLFKLKNLTDDKTYKKNIKDYSNWLRKKQRLDFYNARG